MELDKELQKFGLIVVELVKYMGWRGCLLSFLAVAVMYLLLVGVIILGGR